MLDAGVADARKGIGDQDLHAQHLGDISEVAADAAIADDAEAAAGELPAHDDLGLAPGMIVRRRARNAARQIDHEAERQFGDRLHEAGPGPRDQDAGGGSRIDIDVADIDGAANEGAQVRQLRKYLARPRGEPVGDDDVDIARGLDQAGGVERVVRLVQLHLRDGLQPLQAALAVILGPGLRRMGQQDFQRQ